MQRTAVVIFLGIGNRQSQIEQLRSTFQIRFAEHSAATYRAKNWRGIAGHRGINIDRLAREMFHSTAMIGPGDHNVDRLADITRL